MPITQEEKKQLDGILAKIGKDEPLEIIALTGLIYDTIIAAKFPTTILTAMGRMIWSRPISRPTSRSHPVICSASSG